MNSLQPVFPVSHSTPKRIHIGLVSVLFDYKPEGICTGRLARALLQEGYSVSLITSSKAKVQKGEHFTDVHILASGLREPRFFFNLLARLRKEIPNNFYTWTRRVKYLSFNNGIPDVIYARSWPHASFVAGYELAKQYNKPLVLHFSDPFPPTDAPIPKQSLMRGLQRIVDHAAALTFTNSQTIEYQKKFLNFNCSKAYVIPHVTMPVQIFTQAAQKLCMTYIGTAREKIGQIDELVEGFSLYSLEQSNTELRFIGTDKKYIEKLQKRYQKTQIRHLAYQEDVSSEMSNAEVLVLVDPDVDFPTVSATKLLEYLGANRKVLGITPHGSPSDLLLRKFPESCVVTNEYLAKNIMNAIEDTFKLKPYDQDYAIRRQVIKQHSPEHVAKHFDALLHSIFSSNER